MSWKCFRRLMYVFSIFLAAECCLESGYSADKPRSSAKKGGAFFVVRDYATNKAVVLLRVYGYNDSYAKLIKAAPDVRAAAFSVMITTPSGYNPLIIRMFLGDKEKTGKSRFLQKEGRVCDFACDALDTFYHGPFGKLAPNATEQEYDRQIAKWNQWFDKTVTAVFGPKGGPLRGLDKPPISIAPASETSQEKRTKSVNK